LPEVSQGIREGVVILEPQQSTAPRSLSLSSAGILCVARTLPFFCRAEQAFA
jgi:hypothetical protein